MIEEKSYVGMSTCFWCGETKELILDRRLKNTLPREACYNKEPCDKCKGLMSQGVMFLSIRDNEPQSDNPYRTGRIAVIKDEAVRRLPCDVSLITHILKKRVCFMEDAVWDKLGFPKTEIDNTKTGTGPAS